MDKYLEFNTMEEVNLWLQKHPEAEGCLKEYHSEKFHLWPKLKANYEEEAQRIRKYPKSMVHKGIVHADILTEKEVLKAKSFRRKPRKS